MKSHLRRILSFFVIICFLVSTVPSTVLSYNAEKSGSIQIIDSKGNIVSTDTSWEEMFPYGTFAFGTSQAVVSEGGTPQTVTVYRLGGTKGRATAYITYVPVRSETEENVYTYVNAAGANDVIIQVEDPLPIAAYQSTGKDPAPVKPDSEVSVYQDDQNSTDNTYSEDGETVLQYGDIQIYADVDAESYKWYVFYNGAWELITDADEQSFIVSREYWDDYDFRCVYTIDTVTYCTSSAKGQPYEPEEIENIPSLPEEGIELNPETTYTVLPMTGNEYDGYVFELIFAENEWVKEIIITAVDDDLHEADEFGIFTIVDSDGGSVYDTANTLTLRVQDNEDILPSYIFFDTDEITIDKSDNSAFLKVRRTGAIQYVVSVDYTTLDGSGKAGKDYAKTSGTLVFYGDIDEMTIEIPLVNDKTATDINKDFIVELSNIRGGGNASEITTSVATVNLFNSNKTNSNMNLATMMYDSNAIDISSMVEQSGNSMTGSTQTVYAKETDMEGGSVYAESIPLDEIDDIDLFTYNYPTGAYSFRNFRNNTSNYNANYWRDYTYMANETKAFQYYDVDNLSGFISNAPSMWSGGSRYGSTGWQLKSKGNSSITATIPNMAQMYSSFRAYFKWEPKFGSSWTLFWYGLEYTYPGFRLLNSNGSDFHYYDCRGGNSGGWFEGYSINYYPTSYAVQSWNANSTINRIQLFTKRHDAHDAAGDALAALTDGILQRRYFSKDYLNLRIFTANDSDSAEPGTAVLTEVSGVYDAMKPRVTIKSQSGGVTSSGRIYVGSKLQIELKSTASYFVPTLDSNLTYAVYLTSSNGTVVAQSTGAGTTHYIDMLWSNMDLNDTYTINVVMTRKQSIDIDISPSVPRLITDGSVSGNIDPSKIGAAANDFWASTTGITYGYQQPTASVSDKFVYKTGVLTKNHFNAVNTTNAKIRLPMVENLQWLCFNLPEEDIVLFNGVAYAGNEKIYLNVNSLSEAALTFRYYDSEYISALNTMTASISREELYLDNNGNGIIDGYYNKETGRFVLTPVNGVYDEFIGYLEGIDFEETLFAPVYSKAAGKYVQYYLKVFYSMTPRCITLPVGASIDDYAQVLPAFTTNITNPDSYKLLTREQKSYRYIVSGKTRYYLNNQATLNDNDYGYSSDGHIMYTAAASATKTVDIPLGGDYSPAVLNEDSGVYEWEPDFHGNLLYTFDNPEPIYIEHTIAGDNFPVAKIIGTDQSGNVILENGGKDKLNLFLGSYTGNNTFALCIQEQTVTTEEMLSLPNDAVSSSIRMESSVIGNSGTFPSSEYLKVMGAGADSPEGGMDMSESGNEYSEFNVDMGIELPNVEIAASEYVTIILDGYDVGFAIGIPLGSVGDEKEGFKDSNKENVDNLKKFFSGKWSDFLKDDTFKGKDSPDNQLKSKDFSVEFNIALAIMFKYNPLDNSYYFSEAAISVAAALEFRLQYRFTPVPIVYVYVSVGISVEIGTGFTVERKVVEDTDNTYQVTGLSGLKGSQTTYITGTKTFNLYFKGKLLIECTDSNGLTIDGVKNGYLKSDDIEEPVTVTLVQQDGYMLDDPITVKITCLDESEVEKIVPVTKAESNTYWSGIKLSPEAFIEAGAGVGVEMLKFEIYVKISVGASMTFGAYAGDNEDGENTYDAFSFDEFEFTLGLGFRVVLLLFNFEMDLIQYLITYDGEEDKWQHGWSALGGMFGEMHDLSGNGPSVTVRPPKTTYKSQQIYRPEDPNSISTQAYDPTDKLNVPFQLSGYSSSGDAYKLIDGLVTGYNYRIVTVDNDNYLVYTISRPNAVNPVDSSMIVMSKIKVTSSDAGDSYGLVNPVNESDDTPYIIIDDDGTGDLEFALWVKENIIYASWISYASVSAAAPVLPAEPVAYDKPLAVDGITLMDETNYSNIALFPAPVHPGVEPVIPTVVTEPDEPETVEQADMPDASDYYTADNDPVDPYTTYAEAKEAYDSAVDLYTSYAQYLIDYAEYESDYNEYLDYLTAVSQYNIDKSMYDASKKTYDTYHAWVDYYQNLTDYNSYVQNQAANAAKNTVVKTASFTIADENDDSINDNTSFCAALEVSSAAGSNVFLPDGNGRGDVVFYAQSVHFTEGELNEANTAYGNYLQAIYGGNNVFNSTFTGYLYEYQKGSNNIYGKSSTINISVVDEDTDDVTHTTLTLGEKQLLQNMETVYAGKNEAGSDIYYLAYTTVESFYVDGNGIEITTGFNSFSDRANVMRMYLREITITDGTVTVGDPYLIRTVINYDRNNTKDGIYSQSSLVKAYEDPYFSNLQFLRGELDKINGQQTFLLFEMNGNTYVISQSNIESVLSNEGGVIIPFFDSGDMNSATGKTEVSIGADGAGNISAVYVSTVEHTTNNALFVTKYDTATGTWGEGRMLAMNYMQVYEDSFTNLWSPEDTQSAYYGKLSGYNNGGMTQFIFSNLQIALGKPTDEDDTGTLLIISEGALTKLKDVQYTINTDKGEKTGFAVVADGDAKVGFYAVSFGVGEHSIGEVSMKFADYNFTANSKLISSIGFVNTSDVAIRGSQAQPITVELWISGAPEVNTEDSTVSYPIGTKLDQWTVTQNIAVGQKVRLSGNSVKLTDTLPIGSVFYLNVYEDQEYSENGFVYSTLVDGGNLTVDEKPELGFEYVDIKTNAVNNNGDTVLNVDFQVGNRGTKTAEDVYVQISYQSGKDSEGKAVYTPLDLTDHNLTISKQQPLTVLDASTAAELQAGILRLYNQEDGDDINVNNGRTVAGTLTVPSSCYYAQAITGSMNLKIEIFSEDSTINAYNNGIIAATHNEYNTFNNQTTLQIEHVTFFETADKISIALGSTMRLPVDIKTTTGKAPVVTVTEMTDDSAKTSGNNLGILYYTATGGYIVISPAKEGRGFIRVADISTNSFKDIAYTVTPEGDGINIFNDNSMFTFYNADGSVYDPNGPGQGWSFRVNIPVWGPESDQSEPYLYDLSRGVKNTYFTFSTVSESIDLYFDGTVQVSSTFPGFTTGNYTSSGGSTGVRIYFGDNATYYTHDVTVKVTSDNARFDKYVEKFTGSVPTPADDKVSPQIYWNRSFPDTASIDTDTGETITLTCYVIDESGLAIVSLNGLTPANLKKNDAGFWQFDVTLSSNQSLSVQAFDIAGNVTTRNVTVDWFNKTVSAGANVYAPDLSVKLVYEDGSLISDDVSFIKEKAYFNITALPTGDSTDVTLSVFYYNTVSAAFESVTKDAGGRYPLNNNGYYRVRAVDNNNKYSSVIMYMSKIDTGIPAVTLSEATVNMQHNSPSGRALYYTASKGKNSPSTIDDVEINGKPMSFAAGQTLVAGLFDVLYAGTYTLYAEDTSGNSNTVDFTVADMVIDISADDIFTVTDSWNQDKNTGAVSIEESKIFGGLYVVSELKADGTGYIGEYEFSIVKKADTFIGEQDSIEAKTYFTSDILNWQKDTTINGLTPGDWTVYIRDAQETDNTKVIASHDITVGDTAIDFTYATKTASNYNVSDGKIEVLPIGGRSDSGKYQFAIVKLDDALDTLKDPSSVVDWVDADDEDSLLIKRTYDNLITGWYQILVRDKELDYSDPLNYDNCTTKKVYLPSLYFIESNVEIKDLQYSGDTVTINLTGVQNAISSVTEYQLIKDNADKDIIIKGNGLYVIIPAGTLSFGDSINDILVSMSGVTITMGSVVRYTDVNGNKHILYNCVVEPGMVYYIAYAPGVYEIIDNSMIFEDSVEHWAADSITFAAARGLFNGVGEGLFAPDTEMTRAMFVTVLGRFAGVDVSLYTDNLFVDTIENTWYSPYIQWVYETGISVGHTATTFSPDDYITREQMCVMMVRFMNQAGIELKEINAEKTFTDHNQISSWAKDAVSLCYRTGLINGVGNNRFDPKGPATRAQVTTIFKRFIEAILK